MNEPDEFDPVPSQPSEPPTTPALEESPPAANRRPRMSTCAAVALLLWTAIADWLIYRTYGFAGPALFFAIAPLFFLLRPQPADDADLATGNGLIQLVCVILLCAAAARLAFAGNNQVLAAGTLLLFAMALAAARAFPAAMETVALSFRSFLDGLLWLAGHRFPRLGRRDVPETTGAGSLAWILPLVSLVVFGGIFVFANPDLFELVSEQFNLVSTWSWQWLSRLDGMEIPFCMAALIMGAGLFFPSLGKKRIGGTDAPRQTTAAQPANLYAAFRNTLICLIALFSVYLVFEFQTLFRREFPEGFYYAGYAHEGAAWLTAALALATGLLSIIFQGKMLNDPRIGGLKVLAWTWSATKFLLAIAVYNRLTIYVGFNGLTVMRIVGYFGITVVVVGFLLVLGKIAFEKGFWWLLRTQLTALMLCLIMLALFPVDYVSHRYNAWKINQGYLPPSVMIAVKSKDDSGYLPMLDLVDCPDLTIREGVRAMLAERQRQIELEVEATEWHWTRYQASTEMLYHRMHELRSLWQVYLDDPNERNSRISRFEDYAMQWY